MACPLVTTYDPNDIIISVDGTVMNGFADGTFISITQNNPLWAITSGAGGESARSKSNDHSASIDLTLMQSSASNQVLHAYYRLDLMFNTGKFVFIVRDNSGSTIMTCNAWVKQTPNIEYAKEIGDYTWSIETGCMIYGMVAGHGIGGLANTIPTDLPAIPGT